MNGTSILTPQNVILTLNSNIILWRVLAYVLDLLIMIAYVYVVINKILIETFFNGSENEAFGIVMMLASLPVFLYSLISEFMFNGRTLGKYICGIRVVKLNGLNCGYTEYLLRWLFRLIDIYPMIFLSFFLGEYGLVGNILIGVPAFVCVLATKNHQRLGDIAAGTTVIKVKNSYALSSTIFKEISQSYQPVFSQVVKLSDNDMRIVKDTYQHALKSRNLQTIHKLRKKVENVMEVDSKMNDEEFLDTVMNDFNHYTQDM